jgi:hypothetical protein
MCRRGYSDYTSSLHTELVRNVIRKLFRATLKSRILQHSSCLASPRGMPFNYTACVQQGFKSIGKSQCVHKLKVATLNIYRKMV